MILDEITNYEAVELLEQARHELQTCKKSLAFKESLLIDLEQENAELSETNEKLQKELKSWKREELRRLEHDSSSDDNVDDGYGHWSHDEDDLPSSRQTQSLESLEKCGTCCESQAYILEKNELFEQIEELHQQLEILRNVNKVLQEDVNQKSVQIAELTAELLERQAREKRLEADLEFTAAEREIALRDLHDIQNTSFTSGRYSEAKDRALSIGSSIGEELGLQRVLRCSEEKPNSSPFIDWEEFLEEPEAGPFSDFEEATASVAPSEDSNEGTPFETSNTLVDELSGNQKDEQQVVKQSEALRPSLESSSEDWSDNLYKALQSVCPSLSSPLRRRAHQFKPINLLLKRCDLREPPAEITIDTRKNFDLHVSSDVVGASHDAQLD